MEGCGRLESQPYESADHLAAIVAVEVAILEAQESHHEVIAPHLYEESVELFRITLAAGVVSHPYPLEPHLALDHLGALEAYSRPGRTFRSYQFADSFHGEVKLPALRCVHDFVERVLDLAGDPGDPLAISDRRFVRRLLAAPPAPGGRELGR